MQPRSQGLSYIERPWEPGYIVAVEKFTFFNTFREMFWRTINK